MPDIKKGFFILSKSRLYKAEAETLPHKPATDRDFTAEVMFGNYPVGGGSCGEIAMRWYRIGPQLEIFDDAFHYLTEFSDIFAELAHLDILARQHLTPSQFCEILTNHRFVDLTDV